MARRSKGDARERYTASVGVQLTPTEKAEICNRAATTGRKVSDYCRIVLLSEHKAPAPSARDPEALRGLVVALNRIGNNVNQLAHVANAINEVPSERVLREVAAQIAEALEKVIAS
jgi:hypothetical protein